MDVKKQALFLSKFAICKNGKMGMSELASVIEFVKSKLPKSQQLALLKELKIIAEKSENEHFCSIEYAGELSKNTIEKIKNFVEKEMNREMNFTEIENKDLIAGIRIKAADTLWENSVSQTLKSLEK